MPGVVSWTREEDEIIRLMALEKKSITQTAVVLGRSRNSVVSRARRIGVRFWANGTGQRPTVPRKPRLNVRLAREQALAKLKAHHGPALSLEEPPPGSLAIIELGTYTCRWPYGDRPPLLYCGAPKAADQSYCPWHRTKAYTPRPR